MTITLLKKTKLNFTNLVCTFFRIQLEASGHIEIIDNSQKNKSFVALLNMYKRMTFVPVYAEMMDESSVPVSTVIHHMKSMSTRYLFV
jgi:hypothetical protein